jgi:hypothetical protein
MLVRRRAGHRSPGIRAAALLLAGALAAGPAFGQDSARPQETRVPPALPGPGELSAVRIDPALRRLVQRLDDDAFAVREEAMNALRAADVDADRLCALLAGDNLSAEQRCRLLLLLHRRLVLAPRGALGISMVARSDDPGGIEVIDLVEGMPSQRVLHIGDRITRIDGRGVRSSDELIILIQAKQPGEETTLTVMREKRDEEGRLLRDAEGRKAYETLDLTIELGSSAELRSPDPALALRAGPVEAAREAEMNEAVRRYAPRLRHLALRDENAGSDFIAASRSTSTVRSVGDARRLLQELQIQLILIAEGRLERGDTLTKTWRQQLEVLVALSRNPDLPDAERAAVRAIARRFAELTVE